MIKLAVKNLLQERLRLATTVGGVAAAIVLVLLLEGVFAGSSEQLVAYIERTDADAWVMQEGVSDMHMATSVLPASLANEIAELPTVESATPILYANNLIGAGGRRWFSYVVGIPRDAPRGGPWEMAEGEAVPGRGEAVVPEILARKSNVSIGGTVTILARQFKVIGTSAGTFSLANSVTFVSYEDLADILSAPGTASYLLVQARAGQDPALFAAGIRHAVRGVNALTGEDLADNDRVLVKQMGVDVIRVMSFVGFVVAVLVVGLTTYTATVRRAREYGVAKALGASYGRLLALVAAQTLLLTILSFGTALLVAYVLIPVLGIVVPEVPLRYPLTSLVIWAGLMAIVAFAAALLPAYRISRVEPAVVFKE